ncbi:LLM class flavin-dependent oxidoreductase [Streptomyces antibioticus]|uniref:LLM class flavin-dependent oxidoreductase n=1 Tax=Streptomyces antibioticus TaxID=1890 RepID=UPI003F4CDDDA
MCCRPSPTNDGIGVNLVEPSPAAEWRAECRRAEALGYDALANPTTWGRPRRFPAPIAAAEATERPRLGTSVFSAGFWNPASPAREVATTDALTGGRLERGPGAG